MFQGPPFVKQWIVCDVPCKYVVLVIALLVSLMKGQDEIMKGIGVSVAVLSS